MKPLREHLTFQILSYIVLSSLAVLDHLADVVLGIPGIEEVDGFLAILALGNLYHVELISVPGLGVVDGVVLHFVVLQSVGEVWFVYIPIIRELS